MDGFPAYALRRMPERIRRAYHADVCAMLRSGQVPGEWAVSINARGGANSPDLPTALKLARGGASLFPLATREAMELKGGNATTFDDALSYFTSHDLVMPGYLIVAGNKPGQGAIVTRNPSLPNAAKPNKRK